MKALKERILQDGRCLEGGILKVDNFVNHQIDATLMMEIAKEFVKRFEGTAIDKVITVEASGIAPAIMVAQLLGVPMLFAKKKVPSTMEGILKSEVFSFTKSRSYNICISDEFLKKGEKVVYMEGLHRTREDFYADGRGLLKEINLTVLIDEGSASSSEIFAGAIQDNDRGTIIGRRSFGKGLVQEPINFTDGSGIRLTVARFYTPSGRCIQKPYDKDYAYDIFERYAHGEMTSADSMKVDTTAVFYTLKGRKVYGGGGIIPDVFVPIDTTKATKFYISCNRKATAMRFASSMFDKYRDELIKISDFSQLRTYLGGIALDRQFIDYAERVDGIRTNPSEWDQSKEYMMPQIYGLVGRYSKVGEEAFYRFYLPIDETIQTALKK